MTRAGRRSGCSALAVLVAVALGGCGERFEGLEAQKPPPPPTAAELSRLIADTRQPAYWLGPRFRGLTVSQAVAHDGRVGLTYGPWTCDSGCTDSGGVTTGRRDTRVLSASDNAYAGIPARRCWRRVGAAVAVLLGCDPGGSEQDLVIYTGTREIWVTSLYSRDGESEIPVDTVVRRLRPLNAHAPWPLVRPEPLTCRDFRQVDPRYRRSMPRPLKPAC